MGALLTSASIGAITLFTEDLDRSKQFYRDVFGLPVAFEDANSAVFRLDNTIINLLKIAAAHELIEPGVPAPREAGARFVLTVGVDDVDGARPGPPSRRRRVTMAGVRRLRVAASGRERGTCRLPGGGVA